MSSKKSKLDVTREFAVPVQNDHNPFFTASELEGRILRVVTLSDKKTIHNAFLDRGFKP